MPTTEADRQRKRRILEALKYRGLEQAAADPSLRPDLETEADSDDPQKLVNRDLLRITDAARVSRPIGAGLAFFSSADAVIVPGFMGSELADEAAGGKGLIWIDPTLVFGTDELRYLQLAAGDDTDALPGASVRPRGAVPLIYGGLKYALELSGYDVRIFGFDWRKHIDASAGPLADLIRARAGQRPRPLHLIAHSQGTLVARRAVQMLGPELARRLVNTLVLLGPATAGTFSAAFAIAGTHEMIDTARRYGLRPPPEMNAVLQSMSGLYQLLPWRAQPINNTPDDDVLRWVRERAQPGAGFRLPGTWETGAEERRLGLYGWAAGIDAGFLNDRTTIIMGDAKTVGGVKFENGKLVEDPTYQTFGDGTVPDALARVEGVARVFKAAGSEHMMLPATWDVIMAVRDVLADRHPKTAPFQFALERFGVGPEQADAPPAAVVERARKLRAAGAAPPFVSASVTPEEFFGAAALKLPPSTSPQEPAKPAKPTKPAKATVGEAPEEPQEKLPPGKPPPGAPAQSEPPAQLQIADISPPPVRRLRVFSFDPLFAAEIENLGVDQVTIELPWEFADGDQLQPGPVGEYLEVVDFDSSSRCFYPPVDLNHPHLLAQNGITVSEGDPRFHQQMVYAVAMNTIRQFEVALGRAALWAPNLPRDQFGEVKFPPEYRPGDEYVGRLRVYPHAMRERNAYYSPTKKALLFGYFPADGTDVGRNLPGGMVFSCLSYDIVAHETTHALLDGLHRYFTQPSNPDVYAFHEAFADIVALFQHFSHPEVLAQQIAKARGDLGRESVLGVLAAQFGEASGQRAALREYLGRVKKDETGKVVRDDLGRPLWEPVLPDPTAIRNTAESHGRGAILVAALFRAFLNIYESRVQDLRRIATGGTGKLAEGEISRDLVNRMASEAAKAATHMLRMCARALDYVPPVDVTFGEYLRALITADYDLVRDDDRRYRVAVIAAFRDWGIYPEGVRSLSVDSLLWAGPEWRQYPGPKKGAPGPAHQQGLSGLQEFFEKHPIDSWGIAADRRASYRRMNEHCGAFHDWLADPKNLPPELAGELGLRLDPKTAPGGIRRDAKTGNPVFSVNMFRPCRRIGPDGQELSDVVVEVIQRRRAYFDESVQNRVDDVNTPKIVEDPRADFYFRGGCTLIIDPEAGAVRYCVRKSVGDTARLARERAYRLGGGLPGNYLAPPDGANPFAALHADHDHT